MTEPAPRHHPHVPHPRDLRPGQELSAFNAWVTRHLTLALGSVAGMYFSFVIPLVAFPLPAFLKLIGLVSSYWIQLWALFVLQRSANVADVKRDVKADADHQALSHIAVTADRSADHLNLETPGGLAAVMSVVRDALSEAQIGRQAAQAALAEASAVRALVTPTEPMPAAQDPGSAGTAGPAPQQQGMGSRVPPKRGTKDRM